MPAPHAAVCGLQVWALDHNGSFVYELATSKLNVPFFVKSVPDLDRQYPVSSLKRWVA